ncbi:MAG: cyclic nucleotide-binding domain-containing protein, partial [Nitrospinota bacterium]
MRRTPLSKREEHPRLDEFAQIVHKGRYFGKKINIELLKEVLRQGELVTVDPEEHLIRKGDASPSEMYIIIEGSLVVIAENKLILRLDMPGDVAGEMSVISTAPRSADVIAETACKLIAFSGNIFRVTPGSSQVSVFYVMLAHIMASKLRLTTAQSLLRKNERTHSNEIPMVAIIDADMNDRTTIREALKAEWDRAEIVEYDNPQKFIDASDEYIFDLVIMDVLFSNSYNSQNGSIKALVESAKTSGAPVFAISLYCEEPLNRVNLIQSGVDECLIKPFSIFDLKHALKRFKIWY